MQQGLVCFFAMLLLMHPDHGLSFLHERVVPGVGCCGVGVGLVGLFVFVGVCGCWCLCVLLFV